MDIDATANTKMPKGARKLVVVGKSFRLIDFHAFDRRVSSSSVGEEDGMNDGGDVDEANGNYDDDLNNNDGDDDDDVGSKRRHRESRLSKFHIQMFGLNEQGQTCSIMITDYRPFFYVKVGDHWADNHVDSFLTFLRQKLKTRLRDDDIVKAVLVDRRKLYGFTGNKMFRFVELTFQNQSAFQRVRGLWYEYDNVSGDRRLRPIRFANCSLELYESGIPPLLRYFHISQISPSGWVRINTSNARTPIQRTTTCTFEYECSFNNVIPMPDKETRVPYKICSFDIEASSSHGDFPVPVKSYKRLATNVVDVFSGQQVQVADNRERAAILLKKIIMAAYGFGKFDDVDLVFPKNPPRDASRVEILITKLTTADVAGLMRTASAEVKKVLTVSAALERVAASLAAAMTSAAADGDGDIDGDNDNDNDEGEEAAAAAAEEEEEEEEDLNRKRIRRGSVNSKTRTASNVTTIVDVLLETTSAGRQLSRDDKIQMITEIMTLSLPALKGDEVTFIGSTFLRYGDEEPYLNHCAVVGSCDPVSGAKIESVATEKELLLSWARIIQKENPDVIIGYNIFGFDYEFMFRRAEELDCVEPFLRLSRVQSEVCGKLTREEDLAPRWDIETTKILLASGEYNLRFYKMTGRLQIDMYSYFRRDFNLASYKLDDVAGSYISDTISHVMITTTTTPNDIGVPCSRMLLYSNNLTGLHAGDFIHIQLSGFTSDYYRDGHKFSVLALERGVVCPVDGKTYNVIVLNEVDTALVAVQGSTKLSWGVAKDDVTPQDIFRLSRGSSADRAVVAKYCLQDCNLVHHLMNKIDVITGYVEMARICSVPVSFLVMRGQGIKLTSYVAKKCRDKNTLMPDLEKGKSDGGYEGAIVLPPKCSMYMDNPVACVDYASLYPSSMISQNFSHDSKLWTKEYGMDGNLVRHTGCTTTAYDNLPGHEYVDVTFDTFTYVRKTPTAKAVKTKNGTKVCRWVQLPDGNKSIMPSILEELLQARANTRKQQKTEKDPFMYNILEKRQLGYKMTANSLYGQCGARTSTFYEKDVAASTTAAGRQSIIYAKRIIEEVYADRRYNTECAGPVITRAEYVYGDTDSVFFTFNLQDAATGEKIRGPKALEITIEIAQDAARLCTQFLKPPMELAYEKTLMPFILLSKKRYVGMLYETNPNKGKLKYMGLSLKRRDSCDYLKDTYGGILNILMKPVSSAAENRVQEAIALMNRDIEQLLCGNVSMDKLSLTKALRGYYKKPEQIAHAVLADRIGKRDPGNKPRPGDRIKFVYFTNNDARALQGDKIETPEYIVSAGLNIDYKHYITNQLMKPLQQLFGLALEDIWTFRKNSAKLSEYGRKIRELKREFPDLETFMKKREKYCGEQAKLMLFQSYLTRIENSKNRVQTLMQAWQPRQQQQHQQLKLTEHIDRPLSILSLAQDSSGVDITTPPPAVVVVGPLVAKNRRTWRKET